MEYALVDKQRRVAEPGISGECPNCGARVIAKCGDIKIRHWAHYGKRDCDPWWENETEWHRRWKQRFPVEWQEVTQIANSGEMHRADVKTALGWVFEFQHSFLNSKERQAREAFYPKLIWIVDGIRRERDKYQFFKALENRKPISDKAPVWRIFFPDEIRLIQEWAGCRAPVFFDFGEESVLWWLYPKSADGSVFVGRFARAELIQTHRDGEAQTTHSFAEFVKDLPDLVSKYSALLKARWERQVEANWRNQHVRQYQYTRSRRGLPRF
mgnify:FL=1